MNERDFDKGFKSGFEFGKEVANEEWHNKFKQLRGEIEEYKARQPALAIGVKDLERGKQVALDYVIAISDKLTAESED